MAGGSVHACSLANASCQTVADGVPILTSIAYRGAALWAAMLRAFGYLP